MSLREAETMEAITALLGTIQGAQIAAQALPGDNWPLRRALLECSAKAIEAKRLAAGPQRKKDE